MIIICFEIKIMLQIIMTMFINNFNIAEPHPTLITRHIMLIHELLFTLLL